MNQNLAEATKFLVLAANQGFAPAQRQLARLRTSSSASNEGHGPLSGPRVELHGLQARPELNGRGGVVGRLNATSGRYSVTLADGSGPFDLKAQNFRVL